MVLLCQVCGTANPEERELCARCGRQLMVVSGVSDEPDEGLGDELLFEAQEELEEHLLERISALEDAVRRLSDAVASTARHLGQVEHNLTVAHAGVQSLGSLLETQGIVSRAEVVDGWERAADQELLTRDLSRRFRQRAERILSLASHSGHASGDFRRKLQALELALLAPERPLARELLTDLVRMAPDNDELWSFIGEASFETGDLESARVAFSRVLELRGAHYETLVYLGTVDSDLGLWDEAVEALRTARAMAPESFLPLFTLGAVEVLRGNHAAAVPDLEACLEIEELPQALYLLAVCHLQGGRTGTAIDLLRRTLELQPDFEDALFHLGIAYLKRRWKRLALGVFEQLLELDPNRLQYQQTVRALKVAPPTDLPRGAAQLVDRAERALERGHHQRALELLEDAVEASPDHPVLAATTALLASAVGRTRVAVRRARALIRDQPDGSPYLGAAVVALLEALRRAGRPRAARRVAASLYRRASDTLARGMTAYELALLEADLGEDLPRARDLAREALECIPKELRHFPLAALGTIALRQGRFREAMQHLEQATEGGRLPAMLRRLAAARLAAGDAGAAREILETDEPGGPAGLDEALLGHVRELRTLLAASVSGRPRIDRHRQP